jgi:CMP-2-keto-3-deoxyoctulosonic acid synthetase
LKLQNYVTAKVQNRYEEKVTVNIQGDRPGIELQESFRKIKDEKRETLLYAYLVTRLIQDSKIFASSPLEILSIVLK